MWKNIRSDYIFRIIVKEHLPQKKYFSLAFHNKLFQKKIEISLEDYKEIYKRILYTTEVELIPIKNIKDELKYYFIKRRENASYYHIFFNDDKKEINRNYITSKDKVGKIKIKIDMELKSLKNLFYECNVLKEIKFTKFNREDFTDMSNMFYGCNNLIKLDVEKVKTHNVNNMEWMFACCSSLTELNLINFDTSNVTNMRSLFSGCVHLIKINCNFNTKNLISSRGMFYKCMSLKQIDVSNLALSNIKDITEMFYDCISLEDINIKNFDSDLKKLDLKCINMDNLFLGCSENLIEKVKEYFHKLDINIDENNEENSFDSFDSF